MGDRIKTIFRNGSLRKHNKPIRQIQSLPYTTAASGAPPRQGLAPLKGDISPATHGIWTSTVETFDYMDSRTEQQDRQPLADAAQSDNHFSTKAHTAKARLHVAQRFENGRSPSVDAEAISDSNEVDWNTTIGIAITTDHAKYIEHAERAEGHPEPVGIGQPDLEYVYPPEDPTRNDAAKNSSEEGCANQQDFFFELQAALDKASDFKETMPRSRPASHGTGSRACDETTQRQTLPLMTEI